MSEIRLFAANFAPRSWAFCNGQIVAIQTNQALFSLLGTTYGGNGVSTFALPDFRGRVPGGTGTPQGGNTPLSAGTQIGTNSVTATLQNLPIHTHTVPTSSPKIKVSADGGNTGSPEDAYLASLPNLYSDQTPNGNLRAVNAVITVGVTGNNQAMPIQQPYLGMNYIICLQGIYPSRN